MTLAPPADDQTAVLEELEADETEPLSFREQLHELRPVLLRAAAVLAIVVVTIIFIEYPVAQTWERARQHELLTAFQTPHKGVRTGGPAALLQIPAFKSTIIVVEGDAPAQLRSGPGHVPGTPLPGHRGNSIIVGRHTAWGGPFGKISTLKHGGPTPNHLDVQTKIGTKPIVYTVVSVKHVSSNDTTLTAQTKDYRLTLITSAGGLLSHDRVVVQAVSGDQLKSHRRGPVVRLPGESFFLNREFLLAALAFGAAALVAPFLRRRYRLGATLAVLVPLLFAGLLALLIDFDLLLPPLR
jgi:sortase A